MSKHPDNFSPHPEILGFDGRTFIFFANVGERLRHPGNAGEILLANEITHLEELCDRGLGTMPDVAGVSQTGAAIEATPFYVDASIGVDGLHRLRAELMDELPQGFAGLDGSVDPPETLEVLDAGRIAAATELALKQAKAAYS